ncbi:MAG: 4a-hydroxytetrahydrobiopterin dehydratase [Capsulimonadaceae bacterium]|nr:4a-hydroxytetrahydrobiopterin dehydratase [Capsulimonadaceae bacterium]
MEASSTSSEGEIPVIKLSASELADHISRLPGWKQDDDAIVKSFSFPDFARAMEFVNQVAENAESVQHHPDIDIRYCTVTLRLTTHHAGGLTALDIEFAASADDLADLAQLAISGQPGSVVEIDETA